MRQSANKEEWRKIILSINDNTFFDLMRNYLGQIQTPFNKQDLVDRLINFFSREEITERIISLIDNEDARILTALHISGGMTESQLRHFFSASSYLELLDRIRNLEERFLIYRNLGYYSISPIFENRLEERVLSPALLVKTEEEQPGFDPLLWLNDPLTLALYSFLTKEGNLIKIDGSMKKRGAEKLEQTFPTLFSGEEGLSRFNLCLKVLNNLGLVEKREGTLHPVDSQWRELAYKTTGERYSLYYGAALADAPYKTARMTAFFTGFYSQFPRGQVIEGESLHAYASICSEEGFQIKTDSAIEVLKDLKVLIEREKGFGLNASLNLSAEGHGSEESPLILQPNFELTVKPVISFPSAIQFFSALELKQYDLFSRYALTRASFLKAFNKGLKVESLIDSLQKLSGKEVPQNIAVSLKDWAEDHKKAFLYRGTVLKVTHDKATLIEKTGYLEPFILEVLADGIYLLDSAMETQWMEILDQLSITPGERLEERSFSPTALPAVSLQERNGSQWVEAKVSESNADVDVISELLQNLDNSKIGGDERKELEARIKRKLIFHPSQLNKGIIRPEITEARGMNFQGKVRLVESALQNPSDRLELSYFSGTDTIRILVQPLSLKKEEKERILTGKILPDEEPITIRLGKISRIKKIRSSLF